MGWLVTCTKASRLTDPPEVQVYVDSFLTRVPGEEGAMKTAVLQLERLGVRHPEAREARIVGVDDE